MVILTGAARSCSVFHIRGHQVTSVRTVALPGFDVAKKGPRWDDFIANFRL
jgi:transposase